MTSRHVPYLTIFLIGALVRFGTLGEAPLATNEAAASWSAWTAAGGRPLDSSSLAVVPDSAALFALQHALFWLVGSSDTLARLAPALAGSLVVLVPWLARKAIGDAESIALTALLAFDPLSIGYSRLADATMIGVAAIWTAVVCAKVAAASDSWTTRRRAEHAMWIAAGLAAISGRVFWDLLPLLILLLLMFRRAEARSARDTGVALAAVAALIVSSSGLTQWIAPQLVSAALTQWLQQWSTPGALSASEWWSTMARLELAPLLVGAFSVVIGLLVPQTRRATMLLTICLLWGALLIARPGRTMAAWFALQIPLFLAIAAAMPIAFSRLNALRDERPRVALTVIAIVGLLALHLVTAAAAMSSSAEASGFRAAADVTSVGMRELAQDIRRWRSQPETVDASVEIASPKGVDPVIAWYLRDEPALRWVEAPSLVKPARHIQLSIIGPASGDATNSAVIYPLRREHGSTQRVSVR